jgi:hypothetical protein
LNLLLHIHRHSPGTKRCIPELVLLDFAKSPCIWADSFHCVGLIICHEYAIDRRTLMARLGLLRPLLITFGMCRETSRPVDQKFFARFEQGLARLATALVTYVLDPSRYFVLPTSAVEIRNYESWSQVRHPQERVASVDEKLPLHCVKILIRIKNGWQECEFGKHQPYRSLKSTSKKSSGQS